MSSTTELVRQFPMFRSVTDDVAERLGELLSTATFAQGEPLFEQGQEDRRLFFLVSGRVAFTAKLATGQEYRLEEVKEGTIFGEVACFGGGHRTASARALSDTVLLSAQKNRLADLTELCPMLPLALCTSMAGRLDRLSDQLHFTIPTVREVIASEATPLDRFTDKTVRTMGQYWFVAVQAALVAVAFALSLVGSNQYGDQNKPPAWMDVNLWGLFLGSFAMFIAALVLASERRQREDAAKRDRVWDEWRQDLEMKLAHIHEDVAHGHREGPGR